MGLNLVKFFDVSLTKLVSLKKPVNLKRDFEVESRLDGYCHNIEGLIVRGWARNSDQAEHPVTVELCLDRRPVLTATADRPVVPTGEGPMPPSGSSPCGFEIELPGQFFDGLEHVMTVRIEGAGFVLENSRRRISRDRLRERFLNEIEKSLRAAESALKRSDEYL